MKRMRAYSAAQKGYETALPGEETMYPLHEWQAARLPFAA